MSWIFGTILNLPSGKIWDQMAMTLDTFLPKFEDVSVCPQARMLSIRNDCRQAPCTGVAESQMGPEKENDPQSSDSGLFNLLNAELV